jgi:putative FmdB family regulatory protein
MPIYEYRCSSCGHEMEALQKLSEAPLVACPSCKAEALVKQMSAAGFHLKGSGWYATDFRGGGKPAEKKTDGEPKSAAEPKTESAAADKAGDKTAAADKAGHKAATPAPVSGTGACPASS